MFIDLNCFLRWAMWPMGLMFTFYGCNVLLNNFWFWDASILIWTIYIWAISIWKRYVIYFLHCSSSLLNGSWSLQLQGNQQVIHRVIQMPDFQTLTELTLWNHLLICRALLIEFNFTTGNLIARSIKGLISSVHLLLFRYFL